MFAKSAAWSSLVGGIVCLLVLGAAVPVRAQKKLPETEYDLNNRTITGERVKGPRRVIAKNLNTLRYDYRWTSTIPDDASIGVMRDARTGSVSGKIFISDGKKAFLLFPR